MSKPRKFKRVLGYANSDWTMQEFATLVAQVYSEVPHEHHLSVKVELVRAATGPGDDTAYLAVTAEMTDSFDYTDSNWEPD